MTNAAQITDEQMDFLKEMLNIGSGNAVTALSQMLHCDVDIKLPHIHIVTAREAASIIGDPSMPFACVKMGMVGDIRGEIFFIVSELEKEKFVRLVEKTTYGVEQKGHADLSVLEEVGNILAGVYLTAIHDFCRLNIFHTVPALKTDMLQSVLDELLIDMEKQEDRFLVVRHELAVTQKDAAANITAFLFLILIPSAASIGVLLDSIKDAMPK